MATSTELASLVEARKVGGLNVSAADEQVPYLNMLIYGEPGAGKTVLAGSASIVEDMCPVLVVDVEGGTFSLRNTYPNVDVVRIKTFREMQNVYDELRKGNTGYKTVVLDSVTEMQKASMFAIMIDVMKEDSSRDPEIPSIREWGKNIEQIRRMVRAFRDLPMNVIFTCLSMTDKDQKTGKTSYGPSLSGKLAKEVSGFVDIVGFLYWKAASDERKQFLLTGITETHVAKDRSGLLPLAIEAPTMQSIHGIIFNGKETKA